MPFPRSLERMRAIGNTTLSDTATIMRKVQVPDTSGGFVETYVDAGTVLCRLNNYQIRPREVEYQPRILAVAYWIVTVATTANIQNTDRLIIREKTLEVVNAVVGTLDVLQQVICQEIT
jgi:head-tail adaptor